MSEETKLMWSAFFLGEWGFIAAKLRERKERRTFAKFGKHDCMFRKADVIASCRPGAAMPRCTICKEEMQR